MADPKSRTPARVLALLALAAVAVALFVVVAGSRGGSDGGPAKATDTATTPAKTTAKTTATKPKPAATTYSVKAGDNLGSIAEKTKVPVEKLQELNPDLDSQALVTGQKIKLKE